MSAGLRKALAWFARRGREAFAFQHETWRHYAAGKSGLIIAPTGMGKTLAAALGPMIEAVDGLEAVDPSEAADAVDAGDAVGLANAVESPTRPVDGAGEKLAAPYVAAPAQPKVSAKTRRLARSASPPLTLLWITPLRALASDTVASLQEAIAGMGLPWGVELRTSDTSTTLRQKQKQRLPTVLVTTPESLSVLISYPDSAAQFATLNCVIVDEWHELMGSKRGVQAELGVARLRALRPQLRVWGMSATIANVDDALATLLGRAAARGVIVRAPDEKAIRVSSLLPEVVERFPWAGHLGTRMTEAVARQIESAVSTLVFTNTRSQSELWFRALLGLRPDWLGRIALHHGSLDRKLRASVEQMLREGKLLAVICTSSLDLGVDFWPVDQVMQVGSPKGIARAMQRAGRSGHRPGAVSAIVCVPTQAMELVEFSATRRAVDLRAVERREPIMLPLDLLAQHLVTVASGGGFDEADMLAEVRSTHAFAGLTDQQWQWVMDFARRGGPSLVAYPRFARITGREGKWVVASPDAARMHRMNIGTITADGSVLVKYASGKFLGSVEESFVGRMRAGDRFVFAGKTLEFVRLHEMTAQVRPAKRKSGAVPRWMGGRMPMSASLAASMRVRLHEAAEGNFVDAEMQRVRPILELQQRWSIIPRRGEVLIESLAGREGHHHFIFPFQGRLAHEGLAALLAHRLSRSGRGPITATFNDYGLELLAPRPQVDSEAHWRELLVADHLEEDVLASLNTDELARRHFREIARIAGLLIPARPGAPRSVRALQASSGLFFDVFSEFDPDNLLLDQARREVLERQLELTRLRAALEAIGGETLRLIKPVKMSPLAFPLWAEQIGSQQLRSESANQRIERLARQLEEAADEDATHE